MLWSLLTRIAHIVLVFISEPSRHGENGSSERMRTGYNRSISGGAVKANNNKNDPKVIFNMSRAWGILAHLITVILTPQQKKFADVKKNLDELEEWKKQSREQSDKISSLQQQVAAKEEELVATKNKLFNLHHRLGQQSDLLNDLMGNSRSVDKGQIMQQVLADKDKTINKLQGVIEMYKAELKSADELIGHLKLERSSAKQETGYDEGENEKMMKDDEVADLNKRLITKQSKLEDITDMLKWYSMQYAHWEDKNQKLLNNLSILQQEILQKDEELVAIRNEMNGVLADKERSINELQEDKEIYKVELNDAKDLISQLKMKQQLMKEEYVENEKKISKKFRVKDERLADLNDKLVAKQIVLDDLISTVKKYSKKYENWQLKNKEQAKKISALQEEILLKEKELVAIRNDLKRLVNRQSYMACRPTVVPLVSGGGIGVQDDKKEMSNSQTGEVSSQFDNKATKVVTMKDQSIPEHHQMQTWTADEEMYKDEANDVTVSLTQPNVASLSDGRAEHVCDDEAPGVQTEEVPAQEETCKISIKPYLTETN